MFGLMQVMGDVQVTGSANVLSMQSP